MGEKRRKKQVTDFEIPPNRECQPLTEYIYSHYSSLLRKEELAAQGILWCLEQMGVSETFAEHFGKKLARARAEYPDLWRRIEDQGIGKVMDAAAQRALREHGDKIFLNRCARCSALCRTPLARQCLECGHDWHQAP
ncbi:MAG: hypothetical protein ACF8R7_02300 [Phycisphaerales bacterium JB039]